MQSSMFCLALHPAWNDGLENGSLLRMSRCVMSFDTWEHHRMLPPEHQWKVLQLAERIGIYRAMRGVLGTPDMVNPSLNEEWYGSPPIFL